MFTSLLHAGEIIQIDVHDLLTGRAVTTLTDGKLIPWTQGVDGAGHGDGYMTLGAAKANGDKDANALPGDGCFPANARHPLVRLNYADENVQSFQTRGVVGAGQFKFQVPARQYQRMMVFLTSAEGPSHLHCLLRYSDGTIDERNILLPDYYNDAPAHDPDIFPLATNLAKWDAHDRMSEPSHHNIHGVEFHPDRARTLISVQVGKTAPGYLVFWGATGVTAR